VEELIPLTLFVCVAAVMILRPISKKMGALLEAMTRERMQQQAPAPLTDQQLTRVTGLLEQIARRQEQLEERLDFTERLLSRRSTAAPESGSVGGVHDIGLVQEAGGGLRR
jgi:hypothetical protein